jgi:hypothetical protein
VFLHDWVKLAVARATAEERMPSVVVSGRRVPPAPAGYVVVPWESYYED